MNIIQVPLGQFVTNPYQPRESEDPEHIKKLALSIANEGLLQVPVGRAMAPDFSQVQLAFGHSRLAAYKFLTDAGNPGFEAMPVNVREISDEEMFRLGISENLARKDLTPIEEAKAMLVYREQFKKTSAEIGGLFGLSESAARELLVLFDLPKEARKRAEADWNNTTKPSVIIRDAINGAETEIIHNRISSLIQREGTDMSHAGWKLDQAFDTEKENLIRSATCRECPFRMARDKTIWCLDRKCWSRKDDLRQQEYLEKASAASGIPVLEGDIEAYQTTRFNNEQELEIVRGAGCSNLRLRFDVTNRHKYSKYQTLAEIGFPDATIVCKKKQQFCSCKLGMKAGIAISAQRPAVSQEESSFNPASTSDESEEEQPEEARLSEEDLREIARQARKQKRQDAEEIKAIQEDAAKRYAYGLTYSNQALMARITRHLVGYTSAITEESTIEDICIELGKWLAEDVYHTINLYYSTPRPDEAIQRHNAVLLKAGLRTIESVSVETEALAKQG